MHQEQGARQGQGQQECARPSFREEGLQIRHPGAEEGCHDRPGIEFKATIYLSFFYTLLKLKASEGFCKGDKLRLVYTKMNTFLIFPCDFPFAVSSERREGLRGAAKDPDATQEGIG